MLDAVGSALEMPNTTHRIFSSPVFGQFGDLVRIAGRLKDSSYERDGVTHYTTDRIVEEFGILAAKGMPG